MCFPDDTKIEKNGESFDWKSKTVKLKFDGFKIGTMDKFSLAKVSKAVALTKGFRLDGHLTQAENSAWLVKFSVFSLFNSVFELYVGV